MIQVIGEKLYQYQSNRKVEITPPFNSVLEAVEVFKNSPKPFVMPFSVSDGKATAELPNCSLLNVGTVSVTCTYRKDDGQRITESQNFVVHRAKKPDGFVFKENETIDPYDQPDWNQNDPSAPDYVKNRPFTEEIVDYAVIDAEFYDADGSSVFERECAGLSLEIGKPYTFTINGTSYSSLCRECILEDGVSARYFGNGRYLGVFGIDAADTFDTDLPFLFAYVDVDGLVLIASSFVPGFYSFETNIKQNVVTKKLDAKYIPNALKLINGDLIEEIPNEDVGTLSVFRDYAAAEMCGFGHGAVYSDGGRLFCTVPRAVPDEEIKYSPFRATYVLSKTFGSVGESSESTANLRTDYDHFGNEEWYIPYVGYQINDIEYHVLLNTVGTGLLYNKDYSGVFYTKEGYLMSVYITNNKDGTAKYKVTRIL